MSDLTIGDLTFSKFKTDIEIELEDVAAGTDLSPHQTRCEYRYLSMEQAGQLRDWLDSALRQQGESGE